MAALIQQRVAGIAKSHRAVISLNHKRTSLHFRFERRRPRRPRHFHIFMQQGAI